MAEAKNELERDANALDDRGTDNATGLAILKRLRDEGFDGDDEKLAVALGRPAEEVASWARGEGRLDDDIIMKARGIAQERGIEIE
ncbi:MAG TPA: hypothetical protein VLJ61_00940 [Pyrinomonadaceae bacterium]|jgi:hypothetical protein|nr:hypothetical protein [Pyrinomonadaceae bacterium]